MPHIDRCAEDFNGTVDDLDSPVNASAEAAWIGQNDFHNIFPVYA
jgi:hypothetical protein